jgi:hypothetical protein
MTRRPAFAFALALLLSLPRLAAAQTPAAMPSADPCADARANLDRSPAAPSQALAYAECVKDIDPRKAAAAASSVLHPNAGSTQERARAEQILQQLRPRLVTLSVEVDVSGARVTVDGHPVGVSPLPDPLYLEPGHHVVAATYPGAGDAHREFDANLGDATGMVLRLAPSREQAAPTSAAPETVTHRKRSTPLIIAGVAVAAAALTTGIVFTVLVNARWNDAASDQNAIFAQSTSPAPCGSPTGSLVGACSTLHDDLSARDTWANGAVIAYVVAGAAAASTLAYVFWPDPRPKSDDPVAVRPAPMVGRNAGGLFLEGSF